MLAVAGLVLTACAESAQPTERVLFSASEAAVLVPVETADREALRAMALWSQLPVFSQKLFREQTSRDRGRDAGETLDPLFAYGNRDFNNFLCASADLQSAGTPLVPYAFDRETCPETYVRGAVLARFEGSGTLRRLWMTVSSLLVSGTVSDEIVRLYIDDQTTPSIQVPLAELLRGSAGEIFAPPFGAGSPYFVAWYYPVVFSQKLVVALDRLSSDYFFQADVLLDAAPTSSRRAATSRLAERDAASQLLMAASPASAQAVPLRSEHVTLDPAEQRSVALPGPATIEVLTLRVAAAELAHLRDVRVTVRWDGSPQPAIDLPLTDLFVASQAPVERGNLALTSELAGDERSLSLRLPMPFPERADWELTNLGAARAAFALEWLGVYAVPSSDYGHLHAQWSEAPVPSTERERRVAAVSGRGRYVGLCAELMGRPDDAIPGAHPLNLLEGDLRATADGALAIDGTGAEDYPDNAFYFLDSPKATPFAQNWGRWSDPTQSPPGRVSYCRWQVLGGEIDFQSELDLTMELAHRDPAIVALHRTLVFLYLP